MGLGAVCICLIRMELGTEIGRHSGCKNIKRKMAKLRRCKELLSWLAISPFVEFDIEGERIPNIRSLSVSDLRGFGNGRG